MWAKFFSGPEYEPVLDEEDPDSNKRRVTELLLKQKVVQEHLDNQ